MISFEEQIKSSLLGKKSMALAETSVKNQALFAMANALRRHEAQILSANKADLKAAEGSISPVMLDRLALDGSRVEAMAKGMEEVAALPDPVGRIVSSQRRPNGLLLEKMASPMGVIAIIYESRPNVTSDAAALALKAGSACILRGGKEAHGTGNAIVTALHEGLQEVGLPQEVLTFIQDTSRDSATALMTAQGVVDLLIPRGGKGLISACVNQATVAVLETGTGICHGYVDKDANLAMAVSVVENAKASRPSVCNAMEVCLVHKDVAQEFLPMLWHKLYQERKELGLEPVIFRGDDRVQRILKGEGVANAAAEDFDQEFLDYILAVAVVDSVAEAIDHISQHSTGHSEAIITNNRETSQKFVTEVDSAAVYVNASTRFTDGGEFGLGCEMGISTQKLHARGPLGLEELCTFKFVLTGDGQIR